MWLGLVAYFQFQLLVQGEQRNPKGHFIVLVGVLFHQFLRECLHPWMSEDIEGCVWAGTAI